MLGRQFRVAKLGGSLLDLPDVSDCLRSWLDAEPSMPTLLVVGGGRLVEAIRELDQVHHFDSRWCHWLCVDLLSQTASMLKSLMPEASLVRTQEELSELLNARKTASGFVIVDVSAFYFQGCSVELPETWDTTSDSIAAYLARLVNATELVLLKSKSPSQCDVLDLADAAAWEQQGLVDPAFAAMAQSIPLVRIMNLRALSKALQCPRPDVFSSE